VSITPQAPPARPGRRAGRYLLLALFAGVIVAFFALDGPRHFTLEAVKANRDALLAFTEEHFASALALAFAIYVGAVAFSLPVATGLTLTLGFLFGRWVGTAWVVLAATTGAAAVFLAARYLFAEPAQRRMGDPGTRINAGFTANTLCSCVWFLFPFFLVNLAPGYRSSFERCSGDVGRHVPGRSST
jgi:uncharacterized membrane protein YdjX (TVP38/TMEM64 family)